MNRDKIGTQTCYIHQCMLMYIACLCPNLVSVHFYAIPIYTSNFLNFLFTCVYRDCYGLSSLKPYIRFFHHFHFQFAAYWIPVNINM